MARTPLQLQRTTPSSRALSPIRVDAPAAAFGAGIGQALAGLGGNLQRASAAFRQREDRTRAFNTATDYADFTTGMNESLAELQRTYDPKTQNFTEAAEELYSVRAKNFILQNVPEDMHDEYELKLAQQRGRIIGNALKFQYTEADKHYRAEINEKYQQSLIRVRQDPEAFDEESEVLADMVAESDLAQVEKLALVRNLRRGLQSAFYKGGVEGGTLDPTAIGIGGTGTREGYYAKIRQAESGGNDKAKASTSSATGRYQFLKGTWNALVDRYPNSGLTYGGRLNPKQQEIAIRLFTDENAKVLANAGVEETHANLYAAHFLGAGAAANVLRADDSTRLSSLVGAETIKANSFLRGMTVGDFKAWANKKAGGAVQIDDRLSGISYSDREALYNQVTAEQRRQAAAANADARVQQQGYLDSVGKQIIGGTYGLSELKTDLDAGRIDADNYWSFKTKIDKRDEELTLANGYAGAIESGQTLSLDDSEVKKGANRFYEVSQGAERFAAHDQAYGQLMSVAMGRTGIIPPMAAGQLEAMVLSTNPADARYAAGVIESVKAANPNKARSTFNDSALTQAAAYRVAQKYGANEEEINDLSARIAGQDITSYASIDKAGQQSRADEFKKRDFNRITKEFDVNQQYVQPTALSQLKRDYDALHTIGYRFFRDEDKAHDYAIERLKEVWDRTAVGGVDSVVQYPVEKQFPTFTLDEIDQNLRREIDLDPDEEYILLGDSKTAASVTPDENAPPPSYLVVRVDDDGSGMAMVMDPDNPGKHLRYYPTVDAEIAEERARQTEIQARDQELSRVQRNLSIARTEVAKIKEENLQRLRAGAEQLPIPEEFNEAVTRLEEERTELLEAQDQAEFEAAYAEAETNTKKAGEAISEGPEMPDSVERSLANEIAQHNPLEIARTFVGISPQRSDADFAKFIREFIPSGPGQRLQKTDPGMARQTVNDFWKASGYDQIWQLMSFHNKVAVYDATYALNTLYADTTLNENYKAFVSDPRSGIQYAMRDLLELENPNANPDQFNKALLQRLVNNKLTTGIFY